MKSQRQTTAKFRPGAQRSVQANQNSQKQPKQDQKKEKVNKEEQRHIPPPPSYTPPKPVIQSSQTIPSLPISYYSPIIPDEVQILEEPKSIQILDKTQSIQILEEPQSIQIFEEPQSIQIFEEPKSIQIQDQYNHQDYIPEVQQSINTLIVLQKLILNQFCQNINNREIEDNYINQASEGAIQLENINQQLTEKEAEMDILAAKEEFDKAELIEKQSQQIKIQSKELENETKSITQQMIEFTSNAFNNNSNTTNKEFNNLFLLLQDSSQQLQIHIIKVQEEIDCLKRKKKKELEDVLSQIDKEYDVASSDSIVAQSGIQQVKQQIQSNCGEIINQIQSLDQEKQRVRHDIELLKAKLLHLEAEEAEILSRKEQAETQVTEAVKQAGLGEQLTKYKTQSEQAESKMKECQKKKKQTLKALSDINGIKLNNENDNIDNLSQQQDINDIYCSNNQEQENIDLEKENARFYIPNTSSEQLLFNIIQAEQQIFKFIQQQQKKEIIEHNQILDILGRKIENERQSDEVLQSEILSDKTKNKENDEYQKDNKANSDFKVMEIKHAQLQERVRVLSNEISGSTTLHLVELEGEKQAAIASKNFRAAQRITLEITEARKQKEILETQLIVARNDLSLNEQELSKIDEVQTQRQQYLERGPVLQSIRAKIELNLQLQRLLKSNLCWTQQKKVFSTQHIEFLNEALKITQQLRENSQLENKTFTNQFQSDSQSTLLNNNNNNRIKSDKISSQYELNIMQQKHEELNNNQDLKIIEQDKYNEKQSNQEEVSGFDFIEEEMDDEDNDNSKSLIVDKLENIQNSQENIKPIPPFSFQLSSQTQDNQQMNKSIKQLGQNNNTQQQPLTFILIQMLIQLVNLIQNEEVNYTQNEIRIQKQFNLIQGVLYTDLKQRLIDLERKIRNVENKQQEENDISSDTNLQNDDLIDDCTNMKQKEENDELTQKSEQKSLSDLQIDWQQLKQSINSFITNRQLNEDKELEEINKDYISPQNEQKSPQIEQNSANNDLQSNNYTSFEYSSSPYSSYTTNDSQFHLPYTYNNLQNQDVLNENALQNTQYSNIDSSSPQTAQSQSIQPSCEQSNDNLTQSLQEQSNTNESESKEQSNDIIEESDAFGLDNMDESESNDN